MWFGNLEDVVWGTWKYVVWEPGAMWIGNLEVCGIYGSLEVCDMGKRIWKSWLSIFQQIYSMQHCNTATLQHCNTVALPLGHCPPHFFSLQCETGRNGCGCMQRLFCGSHPVGEELHGCVFPPINRTAGHKYPTVHFVYGGPHFQVRSGLSGLI